MLISCSPVEISIAVKAIEVAADLVTVLDYFDVSLGRLK